VIVGSCYTYSWITNNRQALKDASAVSIERADTLLLNQPDKKLYPIDVYVPENFVLEGDPYSGDGFLIDALTAQRHGVATGDSLYVGLHSPKGSEGEQSVFVSTRLDGGMLAENPEEMFDNVVFIEKAISAVVKPSGHLTGIALFQSKESILAYEQEGESANTQLYLLGKSQDEAQEGWAKIANKKSMEDVYFMPASEEVQRAKELYAQDLGGVKVFTMAIAAGALVAFLLLTLDGLRRQQRQMRDLAVLLSMGTKKGALVRSYGFSVLLFYGIIVACGCAAGFFVASNSYPWWASPELKLTIISVNAAVALLAVILQCGILAVRLKRMNTYDFLAEERE
jgi:hypothetical protein